MASRKRVTLESWIHEMLFEEIEGKKLTMIALVHQKANGGNQEVHNVKFATNKVWKASELSELFQSRADGFAQDMTGSQTFQLLAFFGRSEPERTQAFVVRPAVDPNAVVPSEPATREGMDAQRMRQHEMVFQQTYQQQRHLNESTANMMNMFSHMLINMTAKYDAMFTATKELLMEQALNTHKYRMEELQYERSTGERKKWISFLPMLANTVAGREVFPQSSADTTLIEQFAESLDEQSIMMMAQVVKPELMGPIMSRFEQIAKKKAAEKEAAQAARLPVAGVSPEDDAAGGRVLGQ